MTSANEPYDYIVPVPDPPAECWSTVSPKMQPIGFCYWKGGGDINPWIHSPVGCFKTMHSLRTGWCCMTEPDEGINGRSLQWPCGKVLGGSSSINGLIDERGQAGAHDRWAELGSPEWAFDDVLPYFNRFAGSGAG